MIGAGFSGLLWASVSLVACDGCAEPVEEVSLAEVSEEIQFAALDQLGPHHYLASIHRVDERDGEVSSDTTEAVEIRWQDWDHFEFRRVIDGRLALGVLTSGGRSFVRRRGDGWKAKLDAEPYRVQLRTTWNTWDQALELFGERIELVELGEEVIEGRPARKYEVRLTEEEKISKRRANRRRNEGRAVSLSGFVWLDAATAVRLLAQVSGVYQRKNRRQTVELNLSRGAIGQWQNIEPPAIAEGDAQ